MPIVSIDVRDGDPTIQTSGQHRGTIAATFDDGRIVERNIRAADADEWNDLVASIGIEMQAKQEQQDAANSVDPESEVAASQEASIAQAAVAYLRAAWQEELAPDAYLLFARFNNYVINKGYTWNDVQTHLLAEGLEQEEWDEIKTAYQYLNGGGRPAIMAEAKTIQGNWESK
jgi:hypothetical protein